jgi:hypothetical protein
MAGFELTMEAKQHLQELGELQRKAAVHQPTNVGIHDALSAEQNWMVRHGFGWALESAV